MWVEGDEKRLREGGTECIEARVEGGISGGFARLLFGGSWWPKKSPVVGDAAARVVEVVAPVGHPDPL